MSEEEEGGTGEPTAEGREGAEEVADELKEHEDELEEGEDSDGEEAAGIA